ncbi:MAG: hypothetical protein WCA35_30145, partial [Kovacikia sp.]
MTVRKLLFPDFYINVGTRWLPIELLTNAWFVAQKLEREEDSMTLADDIEKFRLEHPKFHVEIEKALRETYFKDCFKEINEQLVETEELRNGIKDLVFRRYERTLIYYIPWVSRVFDLSDKEIVEIGCGTGCSTAAFAHFAKHIHAYEVSELSTLAAQARMQIMEINNVSIIQSDPESLLKTLKSNPCLGVSAVLLFVVLVTAANVGEQTGGKQVLHRVKQMGKGVCRLHPIWTDGGFGGEPFLVWVMDVCRWIVQVVLR